MITPSEYLSVLRNDFTSFIERAFYELNPERQLAMSSYIEVIATKLEACRFGRIQRLIINVPPRHLKSHCASIAFPAWLLGHSPGAHIIGASYGQDLSDKFGRDCRRLMLSAWYQAIFATRLSDRQAIHDFSTTEQGNRLATSIEGVLTGRGADFIIVDDPLKPEDAMSETRRKTANHWFDNTLRSRLNDKAKGCIIIVMQRLHQDDLVGHVLEQEDWDVVSFPATAEQDQSFLIDTPLGRRIFQRKAGDVLHPERESLTTLAAMRQNAGDYNFSAQYQQNPTPVGGAMVKHAWLKYYEDPPGQFSQIIQSWDTANKANELNDFSVCTTWGILHKHFYLLDVFRRRLNYPDLKREVLDNMRKHRANTVLIEDKASGTQLIQELRGETYGIQPYEPPPGSDKVMRLHAQTGLFESGFVHLPASALWLADYVNELTTFPGSKYDDQVDSTTQALAYMRESNNLEIWRKLGEAADPEAMRRHLSGPIIPWFGPRF